MIQFGKYAVIDPVVYNFKDEPEMWLKFRPVTVADVLEYQRWLQKRYDAKDDPQWIEVAVQEVSTCAVATNIPGAGLEGGGSKAQFEELLMTMPPAMLSELWVKVAEVNPLWGPPRPQASQPTSEAESSAGTTSSPS